MMGQRKVRSDKKKEIKAVVSVICKDTIARLSYITQTPVKDVCEFMCIYMLNDKKTFDYLSKYFKREIRINNTVYRGRLDNIGVDKRVQGERSRVTTKLKQQDYRLIPMLAYALDCTPSRATAILLEMALDDIKAVNAYIKQHLNGQLTPYQMRELREILIYVNRYEDENMSWSAMLSAILEEVTAPITKIREAATEFINKKKD